MTYPYGRSPRPDLNQLADELRRYAEGTCGERAAVELLIVHWFWLDRVDFRSRFVVRDSAPSARDGVRAWVRWDRTVTALGLGFLVGSAGEVAVLRIAAALATGGTFPVSVLSSLDRENLAHALNAAAQASGHRAVQVVSR